MNNQKHFCDISRNKNNRNLIPFDEALGKGTIFRNIYVPYKVDPQAPIPNDEKENLLLNMQKYALARTSSPVRILRNEEYEAKYGSLIKTSKYVNGYPWQWDKNNWPWLMEE